MMVVKVVAIGTALILLGYMVVAAVSDKSYLRRAEMQPSSWTGTGTHRRFGAAAAQDNEEHQSD